MKLIVRSLCFAIPLILNAAGPSAEELTLAKARRYGAQAKECLLVVDQDGMPVADARIWGGLQTGDGYKDFIWFATHSCAQENNQSTAHEFP